MTYYTSERARSATTQPDWVKRKSTLPNASAKQQAAVPIRNEGNVKMVRQLTELHRSVMCTLENTKPATEPHLRLATFSRSVMVAIELAEIIKTAGKSDQVEALAELCTLQDIADLATLALDTGRISQGLSVLEGIGFLLGGAPRATLERALGLLHLKRTSKACDELEKALDGLTDNDGLITALLAQLWYDLRDPRWIMLAKRVLANALNIDARARCTELLKSVPK